MHVEYIRFTVDSAAPDAFIRTWTQAQALLARSPLIESIEVDQQDERRNEFVVRIEWTTDQGRGQYRKLPEFQEFLGIVRGFDAVSMDLYAPVLKAVGAGRKETRS